MDDTLATLLPPRLREIVEDFRMSDDSDKLELLLEFSERLPPLPEWLASQRDAMDQVHECMTPTFVSASLHDGKMSYYFAIPPEAPTVRGFASLLREGVEAATPDEILTIPSDFYQQMGLHRVLSPRRLHGISALLAHMKRLALKATEPG